MSGARDSLPSDRARIAMNVTACPTAESSAEVNLARANRVKVGSIRVNVNIRVNTCAQAAYWREKPVTGPQRAGQLLPRDITRKIPARDHRQVARQVTLLKGTKKHYSPPTVQGKVRRKQ